MRAPVRWPSWPVAALLLVCGAAPAADRPADPALTIGRVFGTGEFDPERLPARQWSKRSSTYFTLEKAGAGRELVRHDPATGKREESSTPAMPTTRSGGRPEAC